VLGNQYLPDSFANILELLDDLFQRAATAAEPEDHNLSVNITWRCTRALITQVPVVSNPAGDFGSLVNDQVVASNWESGMSWGRLGAIGMCLATVEKIGQARPEALSCCKQAITLSGN